MTTPPAAPGYPPEPPPAEAAAPAAPAAPPDPVLNAPPLPAEDVPADEETQNTSPTPAEPAAPADQFPPGVDTETPAASPPVTGTFELNPAAGTEQAPGFAHPGVTNVGVALVPGPQAAAGRVHAALTHIENVIHAAKADIERYVPPEVLAVAQTEVMALVRGLL